MSKTFMCHFCGHRRAISKRIEVDGRAICSHCLVEHTAPCCDCGQQHFQESMTAYGVGYLCKSCVENNYVTCHVCNTLMRIESVRRDHSEALCDNCFSNRYSLYGGIQFYSYKPEPVFHGNRTDNRFYGVELEIDGAGEDNTNAGRIMFEANGGDRHDNRVYCKHDGSLEDGFEIVTHPMTYEYQCTTMPWEKVLSAAQEMGYTSHQAGTCGLHIHVSKSALGYNEYERKSAIGRILYFIERHWEEFVSFSRRTYEQLRSYADRYGYRTEPCAVYDLAESNYNNSGRYTCVNLQNSETIEFRLFRGTLKRNTLIATIQLVHALCDLAVSSTDESIKNISWTAFMETISPEKMSELVRYLKERRLYINETVEVEAEI